MFGEIRLSDIVRLQGLRPSKAPHLRVTDCQQSVTGMDASGQILPGANFTWHGLPVAAGARPKQKALDWLMNLHSVGRRSRPKWPRASGAAKRCGQIDRSTSSQQRNQRPRAYNYKLHLLHAAHWVLRPIMGCMPANSRLSAGATLRCANIAQRCAKLLQCRSMHVPFLRQVTDISLTRLPALSIGIWHTLRFSPRSRVESASNVGETL
jgi:hypothetical protein